jgi:hypothetical protein
VGANGPCRRTAFLAAILIIGLATGRNPSSACADDDPPAEKPAQELHVAPDGNDENPGSSDKPLKSVPAAIKALKRGGAVVFHDGTYEIGARIEIATPGIRLIAAAGATPVLEHGEWIGATIMVLAEDVTIDGLTFEGRFVDGAAAIKGKPSAKGLTIRNCEARNSTRHNIDVDGPDTTIENCHIHHSLWMRNGERADAHGIVTLHAHGLRIRNCNVHHISGDCFQCDRGSWQDIVIEGCQLWDGPLESDMAGFKKGDRAAENAIDTKLLPAHERGRLVVKHCKVWGFRSSYIDVASAFNIKENVDFVADGCEVSDSLVAFRLRGTGRAVMWPAVVNCTIRGCDIAVRYEDNLEKFRFAHNTVYKCAKLFVRVPSRSSWGKGWIVTNNLFVENGQSPQEANRANNQFLVNPKDFDAESLRPKGKGKSKGGPTKGVLPNWYAARLETDFAGEPRPETGATMGAFEAEE